jgi:hypothetical protein
MAHNNAGIRSLSKGRLHDDAVDLIAVDLVADERLVYRQV